MVSTKMPKLLVGCCARSMENATSSAVNGSPPWKRTPGRRLKRQRVGSSCDQPVAKPGAGDRSGLRVTKPS